MVVVVLKNNLNTAYQKHLTLFNRENIEKLLKAGFKFYEIADKIQKHKTTISKEVKKYRTEHKPSNFNNKSINHFVILKTYVILIVTLNVDTVQNVIVFALNIN